jgi:hypothetical protein
MQIRKINSLLAEKKWAWKILVIDEHVVVGMSEVVT